MRYEIEATVAAWTFYKVTHHGFTGELADKPLYGFAVGRVETPRGEPKLGELYPSLDHALVAAVGEKYTGQRGAGGTGVGTAADWFMRMIGADQLVPAEDAHRKLTDAIPPEVTGTGIRGLMARDIQAALRTEGYTLAKVNTGS